MSTTTIVTACSLGIATHFLYFRNPQLSFGTSVALLTIQPLALVWVLNNNFAFFPIVVMYGAFVAALVASITTYRLSPFHPLAKIPGPKLYKISKLYSAWVCWNGRYHIINKEMHDLYGPVIRIGPNEISVIDADAVTKILGAGNAGLPKGAYYVPRADPNAPLNLLSMTGDAHAHRRRLWNRGMSTEALEGYNEIIARRTNQLLDILNSKLQDGKAVIDIVQWLNYLATDIMGDMAFGGGFELLAEGDVHNFWPSLHPTTRSISTICHVPWAAKLVYKIPFVSNTFLRMRRSSTARAINRVKAGARTKDLWYHLTDEAGLEKEKPSLGEVAADGALAIVAGADTTSGALASFFYLVLSTSGVYEQLREEVDAVYPAGDSPFDSAKQDGLTFLSACINETMRLYPPVATSGPRQVPAGGEAKLVAGHILPPGTQVLVPAYARHRSPDYFSDPDAFLPDRWLKGAKYEKMTPQAFAPFSLGPANCVGKNLAKQEMLMILSSLLQQFDFQFLSPPEDTRVGFDREAWPRNMKDYLVSTRDPLYVRITRRGS